MNIDLQHAMEDWSSFRIGLKEAKFPIPLGKIDPVHLHYEMSTHSDPSELRQAINETIKAARGWLMLTDELLHLPSAEPLPSGTPLQGEWCAEGSSWQLRYLSPEQGWRLHQYTVSEPRGENTATHLAEEIVHLRADKHGWLKYLKLWAIEGDRNGESAPIPKLAVLTDCGESK